MYCPVCGFESTNGLNYCKRCGANMSAGTTVGTGAPLIGTFALLLMFLSVIGLAGVGFIGIFVTIVELTDKGLAAPLMTAVIVALIGFGGAAMCVIVSLLLKFLSGLIGLKKEASNAALKRARASDNRAGDEYNPARLPAPPPVMPSVVEHTTRNFDPVPGRDRQGGQSKDKHW